MTEPRRCPECSAELSEDAPSGLCPACLLKRGFESQNLAETNAQGSRFTAPTPEQLARYFPQLEILELLGQGGMGAVYKARQPTLDRLVAIKILPAEVGRDPAFAERFTREARALARLSHPNIVGIYDFGQADGLYYFIMQYVDGVSLRQLVENHNLDPQQALALVPQICEALQFAHDERIVHRDVKPENILLDKRGRVKIADFGLAKLLGRTPDEATLTRVEQVMGTPLYMAPEQMQGSHAVDHRADIYSLGVVFYEMLTGELPLGRFAPPSKKVHVDVRLDEIVLRTLEREPDRRYQHASEVKSEVESIVARVPSVTPAAAAVTEKLPCPAQVRGSAIGLLVTGILNWVSCVLCIVLFTLGHLSAPAISIGTPPYVFIFPLGVFVLLSSSCTIFGALKMMRCEAYGLSIAASVLAMLVSPANIVGLPIGVWALAVLTQRDVKLAFSRRLDVVGRANRRVRFISLCMVLVAAAAWMATVGEIVFLITQQERNARVPEFQLGMTSFLAVVAYGIIIFAGLQGRWLISRRTAIAGSVLLVGISCAHLVLFAVETHRGQLLPFPYEWYDVWPRLRAVAVADVFSVIVGCVSLAVFACHSSNESFRAAAALATSNWRRLIKAFAAIGVAAAASWIAVAAAIDLRPWPPKPTYSDESPVVVLPDNAPTISPFGIQLLQLAPWQVMAMNEVLRGYHRHYLELERKYTKRQIITENREVRATIYPFAADRQRLVDGFIDQLEQFLRDDQSPSRLDATTDRGHFYDILQQSLFPFGKHKMGVDIQYDGASFHYQRQSQFGADTHVVYRELPIAYRQIWDGQASLPPAREVTYFMSGHGDAACALTATPGGKHLVSAGTDGRIIIREVDRLSTDGRIVIPWHECKYLCLAASQKSDFVLVGGTYGYVVKVWLDDGRHEPLPLDVKGPITNIFLADDDTTLICVENLERIHFVDLEDNRVRFTAPMFVDGVPPAKEGQSVWNNYAFAQSPDTRRLAVTTQVRQSNEGAADSRFSVLDAGGTTVLLEDTMSAPGKDMGIFVQNPLALPAFASDHSLRLYLPGSVRTWSFSDDNKVWLDEGSRQFPQSRVRDWTGPFFANGQTLWARYGELLMTFNADSGKVEETVLLDKREWTNAGGRGDGSNSLVSIAGIVPIPQTSQVAVALWDGRVAVANLHSK